MLPKAPQCLRDLMQHHARRRMRMRRRRSSPTTKGALTPGATKFGPRCAGCSSPGLHRDVSVWLASLCLLELLAWSFRLASSCLSCLECWCCLLVLLACLFLVLVLASLVWLPLRVVAPLASLAEEELPAGQLVARFAGRRAHQERRKRITGRRHPLDQARRRQWRVSGLESGGGEGGDGRREAEGQA